MNDPHPPSKNSGKEHDHQGHESGQAQEHEHGHEHDHKHGPGCCGHHSHDHGHDHKHDHDHDHGHGHDHKHDSHEAGAPGAAVGEIEQRFFFSLEMGVFLLWGIVLVWFVTSGRVVNFLTATGIFREQALIGGLGLLVLAAFNFAMRNRFPGCGHDHDHDDVDSEEEVHADHAHGEECCGHEHSHGEQHTHHHHHESSWLGRAIGITLLLVPLGISAAMAPDDWSDNFKRSMANSRSATNAPGASSIAAQIRKESIKTQPAAAAPGGFTLEDLKRYKPPTPEGNIPLSVFDLWSIAGDPDMRRVLEGQSVETVGQLVRNTVNNANEKRLRILGLQITCCASDARPITFPLEFPQKPTDYRDMGYYKVIGKVKFEEERGGRMTVIEVTDMQQTVRPPEMGPMY